MSKAKPQNQSRIKRCQGCKRRFSGSGDRCRSCKGITAPAFAKTEALKTKKRKPIRGDGPDTIGARLSRLGYATYADYLRSAHWQNVRWRYSTSALPQGCACGKPRTALHHKTYLRLGSERLTDLEPVCDECHAARHAKPLSKQKKKHARQKKRKQQDAAVLRNGQKKIAPVITLKIEPDPRPRDWHYEYRQEEARRAR